MDKKLEIVSQEYCDEETKEKLDEISQLEGVKEIVSFPDSSLVSGLTPKSSVIKTKDVIYPEFGSVANNCGMGVIKTDLNSEDITKQKIKEFGKKIKAKKVNPDFRVDKERAKNIFLEGVEYTSKYSEVISPENVENRGNMFSSHNRYFEINQVIPKIILDKFLDRNPYFPIKGNHFIELQAIDSIADENMASKWGLEEKQVLISIHGGYSLNNVLNYLYVNRSEIEKKDILERTSSKIAKLWFLMSKSNSLKDFKNRANLIFDNEPFTPFYTDTKEGKRMIDCLNLGMNYAYGLRSLFYSLFQDKHYDISHTRYNP